MRKGTGRKTKLLGQVFLLDESIFERECRYANLCAKDIVLEIGAGDGRLTKFIAKRAKKVIAVEKDRTLAELARYFLQEYEDKVEIVEGDFLEMELPRFNKIVANIPYSISSKILERIFSCEWELAVMTFQLEFARRFLAKPGERNYSRITLLVNYHAIPEILEVIPKSKFHPRPKVDSVIVRLRRKDSKPLPREFWEMVKLLFQHKRKLVKNAFEDTGIKIPLPEKFSKKRVVECGTEDFLEIYEIFKKACGR